MITRQELLAGDFLKCRFCGSTFLIVSGYKAYCKDCNIEFRISKEERRTKLRLHGFPVYWKGEKFCKRCRLVVPPEYVGPDGNSRCPLCGYPLRVKAR
ncbi:MAG: hypothetical protein QXP38_00170 [Nitrososphaerota archaeon]